MSCTLGDASTGPAGAGFTTCGGESAVATSASVRLASEPPPSAAPPPELEPPSAPPLDAPPSGCEAPPLPLLDPQAWTTSDAQRTATEAKVAFGTNAVNCKERSGARRPRETTAARHAARAIVRGGANDGGARPPSA